MGKKFVNMKNPLLHMLETNIEFKKWWVQARESGYYVHAVTKTPNQWSNFSRKEIEDRHWYLPVCSLDEIEGIFSPKCAADLLLRYRADSIISNMRILRTFEKRACYVAESEWTLASQFDDSIIREFKSRLVKRYRKKLNDILFGTVFSDDPNGYCIRTAFGPIIVFSEALSKFLYFMNLVLYPYWFKGSNVSEGTQQQSLGIAMRTMLLTEAFDFEMDPRGLAPETIDNKLQEITTEELLFVIAHEYAHFLLNHLDDKNTFDKAMSYVLPSESSFAQKTVAVYNQSIKQEFEADSLAVKILSGDNPSKKGDILLFAVTILSYFDIFRSLKNRIARTQRKPALLKSHPPASKRRRKLMRMGRKRWNKDELTTCRRLVKISEFFRNGVVGIYARQPSAFTTYGSMYLDQWRGKPKVDRVDY